MIKLDSPKKVKFSDNTEALLSMLFDALEKDALNKAAKDKKFQFSDTDNEDMRLAIRSFIKDWLKDLKARAAHHLKVNKAKE